MEKRRDGQESKRNVALGGLGSGPQCHTQLKSKMKTRSRWSVVVLLKVGSSD